MLKSLTFPHALFQSHLGMYLYNAALVSSWLCSFILLTCLNLLSFLIESQEPKATHLDLPDPVPRKEVECFQDQESSGLPHRMPSRFVFFSCTLPLLPLPRTWVHIPLSVSSLYPFYSVLWPGNLTIWATSEESFALWLPVGFSQWEPPAGDHRVKRKCQPGTYSSSCFTLGSSWIDCICLPHRLCQAILSIPATALVVLSLLSPTQTSGGKDALLLIA